MLNRLAGSLVRVAERWMPDPFLFCVLLTFLTLAMARAVTPHDSLELVGFWFRGLWKILSFAMQMILILLTGYTLANSRPVAGLLERVAALPKSQGQAIVLVVLAASFAALLNWGFALVASALLARAVARRVRVDFGFLVAGAYSGFTLWASGLSSSIALVSATEGNPLNMIATHTGRAVTPIRETLLAPYNLVLVGATLVLLPLLFRAMAPRAESMRTADAALLAEPAVASASDDRPAARLENSRLVTWLLALMGGAYLVRHFSRAGFSLNLEVLILFFFVAGLLFYGRPLAYVRAFNSAARVAGPLALQYPLYGGIMGLMEDSGLAGWIANGFVAVSTPHTFPLWTFVSSIIITLFVPSGGAHWAVQGPFMVPASLRLGVAPSVTAMAVAFGEQTGNMLQPFWALPILAIAGLGIGSIMGYCAIAFLLSSGISAVVLLLLT